MDPDVFTRLQKLYIATTCKSSRLFSMRDLVLIILIFLPSIHCVPKDSQYIFKCEKDVGFSVKIPANWTRSGDSIELRLKSGFEGCEAESFVKVIASPSDPGVNRTSATNEYIEPSGLIRLGSEYYNTWEYCVQEIEKSGRIHLKICKPVCTSRLPCISKCCSIGKVFEYPNGCVPAPGGIQASLGWKPRMYDNPRKELTEEQLQAVKLHVRHGPPICPGDDSFEPLPSVDVLDQGLRRVPMHIRKDGSLLLLGKQRSWEPRSWLRFCVDDLLVNSSNGTVISDTVRVREFIVNKCFDEEVLDNKGKVIPLLYVVSMFLSAFFLLMTATVYILLWDKHNVHGWTISCHVSSMFFLYVFLAVSHLVGQLFVVEANQVYEGPEEEATNNSGFEYHVMNASGNSSELEHFQEEPHVDLAEEGTACVVIGAIVHLFFISTFCWLTILNFDLWSTFKSTKPVGERSKGIVKFGLYNVFAWGFPAIVVAASFSMDAMYPDAESEVIIPQYGQVNCFIAPWAMGYYVYSIIGALMIVNLIFIGLTSCIIYKFRTATRSIEHSRSVGAQQSFKLVSKLFIVMGVSWVFEIVSWLIAGDKSYVHWVLLDVVNICQAIAIFVIFIWKHKTYDQLRNKFPVLQRCLKICTSRSTGEQKLSSGNSTGTLASSTKQSSLGRQSSGGKGNMVAMKSMSNKSAGV